MSDTKSVLVIDGNVVGDVFQNATEDYVEVTADGVKTYATLLNELYALIDSTKLSLSSYIKMGNNSFRYSRVFYGGYSFVLCYGDTANEVIDHLLVALNNSLYTEWLNGTINTYQSNTPTSGTKITLYYGNKTSQVNLTTYANKCMMPDGTTNVAQAISGLVKTADYNVTFSNNGDYGITLPDDCNIPISCHIVDGWKEVSLYNYSNSWGFHSTELAGTSQKVRLIYV